VPLAALKARCLLAAAGLAALLACCLATEAGIAVCAPVHDALLIEAPAADIGDAVTITKSLMAHASSVVLDGLEVGTDADVIRWPDRYADQAGRDVAMWSRVTELLQVSAS